MKHSIITPFIKVIDGLECILWDCTSRASLYKSFLLLGDHGWYVPVKFEAL